MLPCPRCGSTDTNGTFCTACLKELRPLVKEVRTAKLTCCVASRRIKVSGTWKPIDEAITQALAPALVLDGDVSKVEIAVPDLEWKPGIRKTTTTFAVVTGKNEDAETEYEEEHEFPIEYVMTVSPEYRKRDTQYYEGVLQIRNESPDVKKAIREYVKEHKVHVTDMAELPNGTDYFMTDHRAVGHLARKLHKRFGGELKVNAEHFSRDRQRSKTLYRTNALVSLPEFSKGDVILRDDRYYRVQTIGPKITAVDLLSGGRETFPYVTGESHVLPTAMTKVTNADPVEVLHPRTFAPTSPENELPAEVDDDVLVAMDGDRILLIPR